MLPLYKNFKVILIDFLGYGRSDRLNKFPAELWKDEARQTIALLEHLDIKDANLVGTCGGAWVAINAAFLRPDLVATVTADSFHGRSFLKILTKPYWLNIHRPSRILNPHNFITGVLGRIGRML